MAKITLTEKGAYCPECFAGKRTYDWLGRDNTAARINFREMGVTVEFIGAVCEQCGSEIDGRSLEWRAGE